MTQQMQLKPRAIKWNAVAAISAGLIASVCLTALLWPSPSRLPMPPRVIESPPPFVPSPAFEASNDFLVLQAVLARSCRAASHEILSSRPTGKLGNRSSYKHGPLPEGLSCPSVMVVDSSDLEALFNKPYRGKKDFKHQGGWGNFYTAYPDASGLVTLSLPSYPSARLAVVSVGRTCGYLCGAGWEITLFKVSGKWVIREQRPSWIA